ncbi:MAG: hypothetical protein KGR26_06820, partial [Cyanobacteria bacterium REEB65]|nr:hypothetical protein [Cyanobacteria bacterium REEB65]
MIASCGVAIGLGPGGRAALALLQAAAGSKSALSLLAIDLEGHGTRPLSEDSLGEVPATLHLTLPNGLGSNLARNRHVEEW